MGVFCTTIFIHLKDVFIVKLYIRDINLLYLEVMREIDVIKMALEIIN